MPSLSISTPDYQQVNYKNHCDKQVQMCSLVCWLFISLFLLKILYICFLAGEMTSGLLCIPSPRNETLVRLAFMSHQSSSEAKSRNYKIIYSGSNGDKWSLSSWEAGKLPCELMIRLKLGFFSPTLMDESILFETCFCDTYEKCSNSHLSLSSCAIIYPRAGKVLPIITKTSYCQSVHGRVQSRWLLFSLHSSPVHPEPTSLVSKSSFSVFLSSFSFQRFPKIPSLRLPPLQPHPTKGPRLPGAFGLGLGDTHRDFRALSTHLPPDRQTFILMTKMDSFSLAKTQFIHSQYANRILISRLLSEKRQSRKEGSILPRADQSPSEKRGVREGI